MSVLLYLFISTLLPSISISLGIQSFEKQWTFSEKEIILSRDLSTPESNSSKENRFLYALCDEWNSADSQKTCDLISEYYTPEQVTYKSSCRLSLITDRKSRIIGRNFILAPLGWSGAVFAWLEREKIDWAKHEVLLRARVLDFSNCQFKELTVPIDVQDGLVDEIAFNNVIVHEFGFDLAFHSRAACATGRCRARFNIETGRLDRYQSFLEAGSNLALVLPVNSSVPKKGYFVLSRTSSGLTASLATEDGKVRFGLEVHSQGYTSIGTSGLCERFSFCWLPMRGDTEVHCAQIDAQAKQRMNVTLSLGYKVLLVRLLNFCDDEGSFLLLQLVCTDNNCFGYKSFLISGIRGDGSRINNRPLEISGIEIDVSILDRYRINLFERSENEYCVSFAGPATLSEFDIIQQKPKLTYISKCFDSKYLFVD